MTGVQASVYPDPWQDVVGTQVARAQSTAITGAGTYVFANAASAVALAAASAGLAVLTFDPAWYLKSDHTLEARCIWDINTNDVAPTISFTFGLYVVSAVAGASGANSTITLGNSGNPITGTTGLFTTPAADTKGTPVVTSAITAPAAGQYVLGFAASGADASGASVVLVGRMQVRNVHT